MNAHCVIGVVSGCGGAGASTFAAVLAGLLAEAPSAEPAAAEPAAAESAAAEPFVLLLDCDSRGGGIDVLLGCEQLPGPRWSQVRLAGGALAAADLRQDLPRWGEVSFLAADTGIECDAEAVLQLIDAGTQAGPVVVDLPRWPGRSQRAALGRCDLVVLVTPAEVRSVTSSALVAAELDPSRSVVVVRGSSRTLSAGRISDALGLACAGELPYDPAGNAAGGLELRRVRRGTRRVGEAVIRLAAETTVAA